MDMYYRIRLERIEEIETECCSIRRRVVQHAQVVIKNSKAKYEAMERARLCLQAFEKPVGEIKKRCGYMFLDGGPTETTKFQNDEIDFTVERDGTILEGSVPF